MKKISPALPKVKESYSQPEDYFGTFFRNQKTTSMVGDLQSLILPASRYFSKILLPTMSIL